MLVIFSFDSLFFKMAQKVFQKRGAQLVKDDSL